MNPKSPKYDIDNLITNLLQGRTLGYKETFWVCRRAQELFIEEGNLVHVAGPVTVFGMARGEYYDFLKLL